MWRYSHLHTSDKIRNATVHNNHSFETYLISMSILLHWWCCSASLAHLSWGLQQYISKNIRSTSLEVWKHLFWRFFPHPSGEYWYCWTHLYLCFLIFKYFWLAFTRWTWLKSQHPHRHERCTGELTAMCTALRSPGSPGASCLPLSMQA